MVNIGEIAIYGSMTLGPFGDRQIERLTSWPHSTSVKRSLSRLLIAVLSAAVLFICRSAVAAEHITPPRHPKFPLPPLHYHDREVPGLFNKLVHRVSVEPFNLVSTLIFFFAIVHTFLAAFFPRISHRYEHEFNALVAQEKHPEFAGAAAKRRDKLQFRAHAWGSWGEVEVVFGVWLLPLFAAIILRAAH